MILLMLTLFIPVSGEDVKLRTGPSQLSCPYNYTSLTLLFLLLLSTNYITHHHTTLDTGYTALQQGQALGEQRVLPDLSAQVKRFSIFKELSYHMSDDVTEFYQKKKYYTITIYRDLADFCY